MPLKHYSIIISLLIIFVSVQNSVYAQWHWCSGIYGGDVESLGINNSTVYSSISVDEQTGNLFYSLDNGENWLSNGMNHSLYSLAFKGNYIFGGYYNGVVYSSNNGAVWYGWNDNLTVLSLAVKGNNIFGGTYNYGVY